MHEKECAYPLYSGWFRWPINARCFVSPLQVTPVCLPCRLQSLAEPYYLFQKKGYILEIASLKGGSAPVDPLSTQPPHNRHPMVKRFLNDSKTTCTYAYMHVDCSYPPGAR